MMQVPPGSDDTGHRRECVMNLADVSDARIRIQIEFIGMPEMRLRREQVRRLLGLQPEPCDIALASLVESGFLTQSTDGIFLRELR